MDEKCLRVGVGFATGRRSFQNVLRSYVYHLEESGFVAPGRVSLTLLVAFDPAYSGTARADYENMEPRVRQWFDEVAFFSPEDVENEAEALVRRGVAPAEEKRLLFGNGYAAQRNMALYEAMRRHLDCLIFFDDDEYPMAVTSSDSAGVALWSGQHVIEAHVKYLRFADVTNGYHCGYISPLPSLELDGILDENTFRRFIAAMSSDVLKWEDVRAIIQGGGVTYADRAVLMQSGPTLVEEEDHAKFITGGNLGLSLASPEKIPPFYNPPGARGEDSFFSTCLTDCVVKRVPAYTFHDGFSLYSDLLRGVLPTKLKSVSLYDSRAVTERFLRACLGWVRYKPLYTRLTRPEDWREVLREAEAALGDTIPAVCAYFNNRAFADISAQFAQYRRDVDAHLAEFERAKELWARMKELL